MGKTSSFILTYGTYCCPCSYVTAMLLRSKNKNSTFVAAAEKGHKPEKEKKGPETDSDFAHVKPILCCCIWRRKKRRNCGGFVNMTRRESSVHETALWYWKGFFSWDFARIFLFFSTGKSLRAVVVGKKILDICCRSAFVAVFVIFLLFRAFLRGIGRGRNIYFAKYFSLSLVALLTTRRIPPKHLWRLNIQITKAYTTTDILLSCYNTPWAGTGQKNKPQFSFLFLNTTGIPGKNNYIFLREKNEFVCHDVFPPFHLSCGNGPIPISPKHILTWGCCSCSLCEGRRGTTFTKVCP